MVGPVGAGGWRLRGGADLDEEIGQERDQALRRDVLGLDQVDVLAVDRGMRLEDPQLLGVAVAADGLRDIGIVGRPIENVVTLLAPAAGTGASYLVGVLSLAGLRRRRRGAKAATTA